MGRDPEPTEDLAIHVDAEGTVWIDVGSRLVPIDDPEVLERLLGNLAAERGGLRVIRAAGRADDGDEPASREADAGASGVAFVLGLAREHGVRTTVEDAR